MRYEVLMWYVLVHSFLGSRYQETLFECIHVGENIGLNPSNTTKFASIFNLFPGYNLDMSFALVVSMGFSRPSPMM